MSVGGFVVDWCPALQDILQLPGIENLIRPRSAPNLFDERQRSAAIAIGHAHQYGARLIVERQLLAFDLFGTGK